MMLDWNQYRQELLKTIGDLGRLTPDRRRLVLHYYRGEKAAKIRGRQSLAEALRIPPRALRLRVFRIRENLERCVRDCLQPRAAHEIAARGGAGAGGGGRGRRRRLPGLATQRGR